MPRARKITPRSPGQPPASPAPAASADRLLGDVRARIAAACAQTARAVNSALVGLDWHIGTRIRQDLLGETRAESGGAIVAALSRPLTMEFGRGFTHGNLRHMMRFAEVFPDEGIVSAPRRQWNWTHFREIIDLDDPLKREFSAEMCRAERWSPRTLVRAVAHPSTTGARRSGTSASGPLRAQGGGGRSCATPASLSGPGRQRGWAAMSGGETSSIHSLALRAGKRSIGRSALTSSKRKRVNRPECRWGHPLSLRAGQGHVPHFGFPLPRRRIAS